MFMKNNGDTIFSTLERTTVLSIAIISFIVNILSLIIPVAVQTLVNIIAFGKLLQPVLTLGLIALILMAGVGILNLWQTIIVEIIRQKFMTKMSFDLTKQFVHLSLNNVNHHPFLANYFFEVSTINKSLANLLIYGINLILQIILGLTLLIIYHPLFLLFDAFIIVSLCLVIAIPHNKALSSAKEECQEKHIIGAWLQEVYNNKYLFKFLSYAQFANKKTDKQLVKFLNARNKHFRQLIKLQIGIYSISAISMSVLLCLGGYLVIINQLSLGQLAAAEIVLTTLVYGFKDLFMLLGNYYELQASTEKIDKTLALAVDIQPPSSDQEATFLNIDKIQVSQENQNFAQAHKGYPLIIDTTHYIDKPHFADQLFGFYPFSSSTNISINGMPCHTEMLIALRRHSLLISDIEWFCGTIYQNLVLNRKNISVENIYAWLKKVDLVLKINKLPHGIYTEITNWKETFTVAEMIKLILIRAWFAKPKLLVLDDELGFFNNEERDKIMMLLIKEFKDNIIMIITKDESSRNFSNHLVLS